MSRFVAQNCPGYGQSESRCLPCSGVSSRAVLVCPCSSLRNYRLHSQVKFGYKKFSSREPPFVCKLSSGGRRRNPDFSRQNKNGFSRSRNKENEEKDSFEKVEESDLLSSKFGPIVSSLSNIPKFQATATPGPREKEIVELFRKVQAQLRERTAMKKEKKIEALQGQGKESETVDSLLNLLRKHSVEQGKRTNNEDFTLDHREQNPHVNGNTSTSTSIRGSISTMLDQTEEPNVSSLTRPVSNFRRKSPVPRVKFQVENSTEEIPSPKPEGSLSDEDAYDEVSEHEDIDESINKEEPLKDFNSLKLPELRALAKSLGTKGFSKMKKGELVQLLTRAQSNI